MQKKTQSKPGKKMEVGNAAKPSRSKGAALKKKNGKPVKVLEPSQQERFNNYLSPEFTQRLLDHVNRAVKAVQSDGKE